ncbi:Ribokinase-like protein [Ochromonadaceae sp. CCMP2298]|nr:Ribokinase-like protein [Ochromonadaceae sp. CCMP2298]
MGSFHTLLLLACLCCSLITTVVAGGAAAGVVVVVGSVNADVIVPLDAFPLPGETVVCPSRADAGATFAGGKGANQAVSSTRMGAQSVFVGRFGGDANGVMLRDVLCSNGVDLSLSSSSSRPSGMGLVFLQPGGGVSALVLEGANGDWGVGSEAGANAEGIFAAMERGPVEGVGEGTGEGEGAGEGTERALPACVLLQMEIPQTINEAVAAAAHTRGVPVFQDLGGAVRTLTPAHLSRCAYLSPNLSELRRATGMPADCREGVVAAGRRLQEMGARRVLITLGAEGALLLLERGETMEGTERKKGKEGTEGTEGAEGTEGMGIEGGAEMGILYQPGLSLGNRRCLDETGAGDVFRAAFAVSLCVQGRSLAHSLRWAAAAGALAVTRLGAIPACPTGEECQAFLDEQSAGEGAVADAGGLFLRGGFTGEEEECPFQFASRLNSMKDRLDLFEAGADAGTGGAGVERSLAPEDLVRRQGQVRGLSLVDFNYPQHLTHAPLSNEGVAQLERIKRALAGAGLGCGAVCLRFPKSMQGGAFTHADADIRARAVQLTKDACRWAADLGASEVVVWSAFDGYDYPLQADHSLQWEHIVTAFQEVCDAHPSIRISLEFKPTDENTRFFSVPSTGAAVLLERQVCRGNFGLTLDFGHCLMAGENPAQSVAMVQRMCTGGVGGGRGDKEDGRGVEAGGGKGSSWGKWSRGSSSGSSVSSGSGSGGGKLFGVQLGDGYGRLGAEDGLAFGSVNRPLALEFVVWLLKTDYRGHIYFDTFPRNEDPVREAEYNIRQFKRLYGTARRLIRGEGPVKGKKTKEGLQGEGLGGVEELSEGVLEGPLQGLLLRQDAMGTLELLERMEHEGGV